MKYLIGNWKANKTINELLSWTRLVKKANVKPNHDLKVVLCPSFIHLALIKKELPNLVLGSQDISPYADGAYTGAITGRMLEDYVKYVIVGHSERHSYFHETESEVNLKVERCLEYNLTPILAVHDKNWEKQLRFIDENNLKKLIVMYEPPEAISQQTGPIGKGKPAPLSKVTTITSKIREKAKPKAVIYGGSIKANNIEDYLSHKEIDGVLPGSASLNASEWLDMIINANKI
jgi:triosephosphate isomerase